MGFDIVVTSLYVDKELCIDEQTKLNDHSFSYILKEIDSNDETFINSVKNHNFDKVMDKDNIPLDKRTQYIEECKKELQVIYDEIVVPNDNVKFVFCGHNDSSLKMQN